MKPSIAPFVDFLSAYSAPHTLSQQALAFAGVVVDRSCAGHWQLDSSSEIDLKAALRTFNSCFKTSIDKVEIVSLSSLQGSPTKISIIMSDLVPVDADLCIEALDPDIESRIDSLMETRFSEAMTLSLDPDGDMKGPTASRLKNIPLEFMDGLALSIIMSFMPVLIAALGDAKLFEGITPAIRLTQSCLCLGCTGASRDTLLLLAS